MLTRSKTQVPDRVRDYNLASASGPRQPRIDIGPWTEKGRGAKSKIGRALVVRLVNYRYVCTYITISSLCVPLLFEFISIFRNIIMDITHTSKKRPKND